MEPWVGTQNDVATQSGLTRETLAAKKAEITRMVNNALSALTETNRTFLNAHLETLRGEMEELNRQEDELNHQVAQHEQVDTAVDAQFAIAAHRLREARKVLVAGTIEEQQLIIRAFLRKITFDPDTRTGTAEFWLIPGAGNEDPRRNPAGRGRRTDIDSIDSGALPGAQDAQGTLQQRMINLAV